jgi:hypothetical protein
MADKSIELLISAKNEASLELVEAEKSFVQFQKTVEAETQAIKRLEIAFHEGEEALYAYDLQMKGLDETTAKTIARQRQAAMELKKMGSPSAGKATKTTTEFVGTLANLTGSSELANFAGQLGNLSEKSEQFAEAGKKGGAGALAFKAGLVAAVAAIAVSAGKFLGDWIFETKRWAEELENAKNKARELEQQAASMRDMRFADTTADIELIRDPEQKQQAYEKLLADLKKNVSGVSSQVKSSEKAVKEWAEAWQITGDRKGFAEQAQLQLDQDKERLEQLKEQQQQIERLLGVEKERAAIQVENAKLDASENYVESLREQLRLLKATGDEQRNIQAEQAGAVGSDVGEASMLLAEIDRVNQLKEQEKLLADERKKAAEEQLNAQKKIEELKSSELAKLEEERVALERGKEAAHAFRLEKQGLAKADAERIAMMQAELEKERERKTQQEQSQKAFDTAANQPLQVQSSRFLTRGPTEDKTSKLVDLSKSQLKANEQAAKALSDLVTLTRDKKPSNEVRLVKVGGGV